jgi:hypothetical protein
MVMIALVRDCMRGSFSAWVPIALCRIENSSYKIDTALFEDLGIYKVTFLKLHVIIFTLYTFNKIELIGC